VCWAQDEAQARGTAPEWWPNIGLGGELSQVLPQPAHFEAAAENAGEEDVAAVSRAGPTRSGTSSSSSASRTPATTTCTCIRWGPSRRASSASTIATCCRGLGLWRRRGLEREAASEIRRLFAGPGYGTPPLEPRGAGPGRVREVLTGIGSP
jgi:plasmid stabilization system protein ParE